MDHDQKQPLLQSNSTSPEGPPAYDYGTQPPVDKPTQPQVACHESTQVLIVRCDSAGPSGQYTMQPSAIPAPTVFNYVNARTGETVVSLLPPNHPEMICIQTGHEKETQYGLLGVLAAIIWFPLGIGLCLLDRRVKCKRCGMMIQDGVCS
ncbi:hypothetical protein D9619_011682 [Psilocybe cf. subviscida]|uniref:Brain protein I3 n=1 Tax=Psilocybe cf. subviscida TaxID=2480587 RepID=A0A8H5FA55_9AGAR|nr:hypothetical protein D9619_011682 [Psilocybe cf. subviscida]